MNDTERLRSYSETIKHKNKVLREHIFEVQEWKVRYIRLQHTYTTELCAHEVPCDEELVIAIQVRNRELRDKRKTFLYFPSQSGASLAEIVTREVISTAGNVRKTLPYI